MKALSKLNKLTNKKGMSLPELITVVVLIAIIGAAAISYVVSAVTEAQANTKSANATALAQFLNQAVALGCTGLPANGTPDLNALRDGFSLPNGSTMKVRFQGTSMTANTYTIALNGTTNVYTVTAGAGNP